MIKERAVKATAKLYGKVLRWSIWTNVDRIGMIQKRMKTFEKKRWCGTKLSKALWDVERDVMEETLDDLIERIAQHAKTEKARA